MRNFDRKLFGEHPLRSGLLIAASLGAAACAASQAFKISRARREPALVQDAPQSDQEIVDVAACASNVRDGSSDAPPGLEDQAPDPGASPDTASSPRDEPPKPAG